MSFRPDIPLALYIVSITAMTATDTTVPVFALASLLVPKKVGRKSKRAIEKRRKVLKDLVWRNGLPSSEPQCLPDDGENVHAWS